MAVQNTSKSIDLRTWTSTGTLKVDRPVPNRSNPFTAKKNDLLKENIRPRIQPWNSKQQNSGFDCPISLDELSDDESLSLHMNKNTMQVIKLVEEGDDDGFAEIDEKEMIASKIQRSSGKIESSLSRTEKRSSFNLARKSASVPSNPLKRMMPMDTLDVSKRREMPWDKRDQLMANNNNKNMVADSDKDIKLSVEQEKAYNLAMKGNSIFFTGSAGTGKSVLLRKLISAFTEKFRGENQVAVTSTTGMAAVNINGTTLHRWAGVGVGKGEVKKLIGMARKRAKDSWYRARVLIIDEVSMLDPVLFDNLNAIGQEIRGDKRPFGGIQLILTGDFFQLPPVNKDRRTGTGRFCFEAKTWKECVPLSIELKQVFRQKDSELIEMLNAMRMGEITNAIEQKFYALARPVRYDDGIEPMELYPTKNEVKQSNERRLRDLGSKAHKYVAKDNTNSGGDPELTQQRIAMLDNTFLVEKELVLSVGAQVMYLINDPNEGLVNGSRGKIVTFCSTESWRKLVLQDSKYGVIDMYKQAFDKDEVEYGLMFQEQLDTLKGNNISVYNNLRTALHGPDEKLPVVDFGDGNPRLIEYHDFTVDDPRTDRAMAVRNQIPLILSWALSIHKAQGQTIPRLRVNLQKSFEFGQAYVAVSRAVSRDQLQILNFRRAAVMADPKVKQFYKSLQTL